MCKQHTFYKPPGDSNGIYIEKHYEEPIFLWAGLYPGPEDAIENEDVR